MPNAIRGAVADGANPSAVDESGRSMLARAAWYEKWENAKVLIELGANVHHLSSCEGQVGSTALFGAAWHGHKETAELLLSAGARKDVVDTDGDTAYSVALRQGHTELAELLKV